MESMRERMLKELGLELLERELMTDEQAMLEAAFYFGKMAVYEELSEMDGELSDKLVKMLAKELKIRRERK